MNTALVVTLLVLADAPTTSRCTLGGAPVELTTTIDGDAAMQSSWNEQSTTVVRDGVVLFTVTQRFCGDLFGGDGPPKPRACKPPPVPVVCAGERLTITPTVSKLMVPLRRPSATSLVLRYDPKLKALVHEKRRLAELRVLATGPEKRESTLAQLRELQGVLELISLPDDEAPGEAAPRAPFVEGQMLLTAALANVLANRGELEAAQNELAAFSGEQVIAELEALRKRLGVAE